MTLKIISAEKIEFEGTVTLVSLPGAMGGFTVLENHAALISSLVAGDVVYDVDGQRESRAIKGGVADINNNVVSVCIY